MLEIAVLGSVRVSFAGRALRFASRKSSAVVAYLALDEDGQETRERLVGLLWSESEEHKARASLRQIVHELRSALSQTNSMGFEADRLALRLDRANIAVDLQDILASSERHEVHPLILQLPQIADSLLGDLEEVDPAFRVWLLAKRQTIHDRLLRNLEAGMNDERADRHARQRLAEGIFNLDPTHEEACRLLMRSRAESGDVSGALRVYATLWKRLDEEYDMEPSVATQALVGDIKQGLYEPVAAQANQPAFAATRAIAPERDELSRAGMLQAQVHVGGGAVIAIEDVQQLRPTKVALLVDGFGLNGIAPDQVHLVEGFRHHLIACLTRFREWYVSDSAAQLSGTGYGPAVSAVYTIEATAYQAGETINMVMTLRERSANLYVWSERFELELDHWFDAQQRIVRRLSMSLNVQISIERLMRFAGRPDVSLDIYDRCLRGQAMLKQFSLEDWNRAAQIFGDAISEAPDFSLAYSSLAQMNNVVHIVHPGTFRDPLKAVTTLNLARRSVSLDPIDSRAQLCLGWALAMVGQHDQATLHMDLACELNPYDSWTSISAALFHAYAGNTDSALRLAEQSLGMTLAPSLAHWTYQAIILFIAGNYPGCIAAADHAQDVLSTLPAWRAAAFHFLGEPEAAAREGQRFIAGIRRQWFGSAPASAEAIGRWLLHIYPIRLTGDWERLKEGVAGAGIPVAGCTHNAWQQ